MAYRDAIDTGGTLWCCEKLADISERLGAPIFDPASGAVTMAAAAAVGATSATCTGGGR